jgi:hypothetical protein
MTEVLTHILSHLPPETLSSMSLVSRRFHKMVTTPHAWRIAFARYFPGPETASTSMSTGKSQRRSFTRLSALASWRSEYILRTRLLRSLARGRPALQATDKSKSRSQHSAAVMTYQSGLLFPVSHIHASFGTGLNKKQPLFVHGAAEQGLVSSSDPGVGKVGNWGLADFQAFKHFSDLFVGEAEYGLGPGNVVGMSNVMDVSQNYGRAYGEACPGGRLFYTATNEQRGRFLNIASTADHASGIPEVSMIGCAITSVWLAKSEAVLKVTNGLFGLLAGFSNGVLAAYATGPTPFHERRFDKGEPTAKWVLCPGVPITAIVVDERVSRRRVEVGRPWAFVLNALGEVFHLHDLPVRPDIRGKLDEARADHLAWQTGRSAEWMLVEPTRRQAKIDPYGSSVDGSYSPRTSSDATGLTKEQIVAETKEVEQFLLHKPKHFRGICEGWDMRRKLLVDFAGDDRHGAGEAFLLASCGLDDCPAAIKRFTRCRRKVAVDYDLEAWPTVQVANPGQSIFGGSEEASAAQSPRSIPRSRTSSTDDLSTKYDVEWRISTFSFSDLRNIQVTAVAMDNSDLATITAQEDPLLGMSGGSNASSPIASPLGREQTLSSPSDIPGHRARLVGIGTMNGVVVLWDMRASLSHAIDVVNTIEPVRTIFTRSPQISSLALSSLYIVHGGNDGLVQAWDPLASTTEPVRTLNSRFSDRARRRIAQADASQGGVGHNYFAAGAIILDPDPTVLRGLVSLGTHLRYWSYSSTAADAYKSKKRGQLRRRSNTTTAEHKVTATGRGVLKDYILSEQVEMEREKAARRREKERMEGRFGMGLLGEGASEEEMLAYATMLSEEAFASDNAKRQSGGESELASPSGSRPVTADKGVNAGGDMGGDADLEEALRLSLMENAETVEASSGPASDIPIAIRYSKGKKRGTGGTPVKAGSGSVKEREQEEEDLEFALQLSLAEEQSWETALPRHSTPPSSGGEGSGGRGKGKGKRR